MPHELLQCRNPHVFIRFVRAERMTKRMHSMIKFFVLDVLPS
jgi:hypothetical protein